MPARAVATCDINQVWAEQSLLEVKAVSGGDCTPAIVAEITNRGAIEQAESDP